MYRPVEEEPDVDVLDQILVRLQVLAQVWRARLFLTLEEEDQIRSGTHPVFLKRGQNREHRADGGLVVTGGASVDAPLRVDLLPLPRHLPWTPPHLHRPGVEDRRPWLVGPIGGVCGLTVVVNVEA